MLLIQGKLAVIRFIIMIIITIIIIIIVVVVVVVVVVIIIIIMLDTHAVEIYAKPWIILNQ